MAHLWQNQNGTWLPVPLTDPAVGLSVEGELRPVKPEDTAPVRLYQAKLDWVLLALCGTRVRINGDPLALGIRVLADRDEIGFGGIRAYFSTERLARIEPFPDLPGIFCVRCKRPIEPNGTPAVQCPSCNRWHHERTDSKCWTYGKTCTLCPHPTGLDLGYLWEPPN
jgi:hypothetical protein